MILEQRASFSSTCRIAMLGVISTWSLRQWFSTHKTAALDVATQYMSMSGPKFIAKTVCLSLIYFLKQ